MNPRLSNVDASSTGDNPSRSRTPRDLASLASFDDPDCLPTFLTKLTIALAMFGLHSARLTLALIFLYTERGKKKSFSPLFVKFLL